MPACMPCVSGAVGCNRAQLRPAAAQVETAAAVLPLCPCRRCTYTAWRRTLPSGKSEYKSITISGALCAAAVSTAAPLCSWRSGSMGCCSQCLPPQRAKLCSPVCTTLQPLQACLNLAIDCRGLDRGGVHGLLPG